MPMAKYHTILYQFQSVPNLIRLNWQKCGKTCLKIENKIRVAQDFVMFHFQIVTQQNEATNLVWAS